MSRPSPAARERRMVVRAGLFVGTGLLLAALVVFFIGEERGLFERQVTYRTAFANVDGLTENAPVWLGGRRVGSVAGIRFPTDLRDTRIHVDLEVDARYAERVRGDSTARLSTLGVLGDKTVDISLGSAGAPPIPPGGFIRPSAAADLSALMRSAAQVMEDSVAITESLRDAVTAYASPQFTGDLAAIASSLRAITEEVHRGDGALHALVFDRQGGEQMRTLLAEAASTARRVDRAVAHAESILGEVRSGDGALHALLYEREGAEALTELSRAAGELAALVHDVRANPDSALGQLVYGDSGRMLEDLGAAAADLRKVTSLVASGEGSLGGIIQDPTLYEDLRTLIGNVKRNRVLRALVRLSIQDREQAREEAGRPGGPPEPPAYGGSPPPEQPPPEP